MITTEIRPDQYSPYVYAIVLVDGRWVANGPPRLTESEAVEEALRCYREAHLPRRMRAEERVSYGCVDDERRECRTVSSMIEGKSAAAYWGGW